MNRESLEMAVEDAKRELSGRPIRKTFSWVFISIFLFAIPVFFFFSQQASVYRFAYAPLVVGWLMISIWIGNVIARNLIAGKTIELTLSVEMANAILELTKKEENK